MAIYNAKTLDLVKVNDALEKTTKYSKNELLSLGLINLFSKKNREKAIKRNDKIDINEISKGFWSLENKNGTEYFVTLISTPAISFGENCRLAIAFDATEIGETRKLISQKETQLASIQSLGSHGVRKHIANIIALGTLMGILSKEEIEQEKILEKIIISTQFLDEEIKKLILEASKNYASKVTL